MNTPFSRKTGSQSEIPQLRFTNSKVLVEGYQGYEIANRKINLIKTESEIKFCLFKPYLSEFAEEASIVDIGCSAGAIGIQLVASGRTHVTFLDHDEEYTGLVQRVLSHIGSDTSNQVVTSQLSNYDGKHDVGLALALIHWLYSYTERYGSLSDVMRKLKYHSQKMLIVEWVGLDDPAILSAGHIFKNSELHTAPYNYDEFKSALREHYNFVKLAGKVNDTREIWIASMEPLNVNTRSYISSNLRIKYLRTRDLFRRAARRLFKYSK